MNINTLATECKEIHGINNELEQLKKSGELLAINVDTLYDKLNCMLVPSTPEKTANQSPVPELLSLLSKDIKSVRNTQIIINDKIEELIRRLDV